MRFRLLLCLACSAIALPLVAVAEDSSFETDVRPILETHCYACHDRETLSGGVGLDSFYHASKTTDGGDPLLVPGDPEASALYQVLVDEDPKHRMPLDEEPLAPEKVAAVRHWIEAGASWPDDGWRPPKHWSFVPPTRPEPPACDEAQLAARDGNEIDRFVAAKLAEHKLEPNPQAEPARLLRRLYLDLIGLPPSVAEVEAFERDPSFANYTRAVDRLLASPAYGERWATPWLDLARYADSEGYQRDSPRSMWAYRQWVIDSLNADVPFDRFTVEQLAGDLLPDATPSQTIATAFHRNAPTNLEAGTDPAEDRYKVIVDRVNTTAAVWLGLTVGCAQCHNHKYDPISAEEYYQLYAFFDASPMESRQEGEAMGMSNLEAIGPTAQLELTPAEEASLAREEERFRLALSRLEGDIRTAVDAQRENRPKWSSDLPENLAALVDSVEPWTLPQCKQILKAAIKKPPAALSQSADELQEMDDRLTEWRTPTVRVMRDAAEPRATYVAKRGDFLNLGRQVFPTTPASLHPFDETLPRNRLGLARWLVDPQNPLVARAYVNRLWAELFGRGLVTTPTDFGAQGDSPSHPELLDWLAVAFVEDDQWSMKKMLRRVVLSATYRQSVAVRADSQAVDPNKRLLWRHPGQRLGAEAVRDNALAIAGLLNRSRGGFSVRPYQPPTFWRRTAGAGETHYSPSTGPDAYRRGVYTLWRRNAHYPSFANFDAPDRTACTVQRDVSNTPLQALTLLNDPIYVEAAEAFAERIVHEAEGDAEARIAWAFRRAVARSPRPQELAILKASWDEVIESGGAEADACREVATVLLNLHETIHRN